MKTSTQNMILVGVTIISILMLAGFIPNIFSGFFSANIGSTPTSNGNLISVSKPVRFFVADKYGGSAMSSQTLYVYDSGMTLIDTLTTDSNGQDDTNSARQTGEVLNVLAVGSTGERKWFKVTVPGQSAADADSLTTNPVNLEFYDYTAPTLTVVDQAGTAISDAGDYNKTTSGNTAVLTVTWYQGTDGDGYMSSYDPLYGLEQSAVLVLKLSNTNYETVGVTGMDGGIERASAKYFYKVIDPTTLSKWKVGNDYRYDGTGSHTLSLDLASYSGDSGDADFYIYYFADWNYWLQHGSFGPNALSVISGAPHTVNLID